MKGLGLKIIVIVAIFITWFAFRSYFNITNEQNNLIKVICTIIWAITLAIIIYRKIKGTNSN